MLQSRTRKLFLEEGLIFSLPEMRRRGYFRPGISPGLEVVEIYRDGRAAGEIEFSYETTATNPAPWLTIRCFVRGREIRSRFDLVARPQPFGGASWYMRCAETGALARTVYLLPGARRFRSRKALAGAAAYRSTHLDAGWRALNRRDRIGQRVFRQGPPEWQAEQKADFPGRPPWMRWPTWYKALEAWQRWDERAEGLLRLR